MKRLPNPCSVPHCALPSASPARSRRTGRSSAARTGTASPPRPGCCMPGLPGGPRVLWSTKAGQGYAAAAIAGGRVYFDDYDETAGDYLVRCLTLADGKELWRFRESRRIRPNHAITRTVPATDGSFVFSLDPKAVLHALDAGTGRELWRKDLVQVYGSQIPPWYNGQNRSSRRTASWSPRWASRRWSSPWTRPAEGAVAHAESRGLAAVALLPDAGELGGVDQYLFNVLEGTVGVAAADGKRLWHFPFKFNLAVPPSPLAVDAERVYVTGPYDPVARCSG